MKGMGEGGAISPPAAIANAIRDDLAPLGAEVNETRSRRTAFARRSPRPRPAAPGQATPRIDVTLPSCAANLAINPRASRSPHEQDEERAMTSSADIREASLVGEMDRHIATYGSRREDWSVFEFETKKDPKFARAQRRYVGASGSLSHADSHSLSATSHTLTIMMLPAGHATPLHTHEADEIFFVLEGSCTAIWERDGESAERVLEKWDMLCSPPGHAPWPAQRFERAMLLPGDAGQTPPKRPSYQDPELTALQAEADTG